MCGALGQHQRLAALALSVDDLGSDCVRSGLINGKVPAYIVNPRVLRQIDPRVPPTGTWGAQPSPAPGLHEHPLTSALGAISTKNTDCTVQLLAISYDPKKVGRH
jgi:hypothetical protein